MEARARTVEAAQKIYGEHWDHSSMAARAENLFVFEQAVAALNNPAPSYLEIGSALGMSMSIVGSLLPKGSQLVSVDPYFEDGYIEGERAPELASCASAEAGAGMDCRMVSGASGRS